MNRRNRNRQGAAKRMFLCILTGMMIWTGLAACARPASRYQAQFMDVFDTVSQVIGYSSTKAQFTKEVQEIRDMLTEYHQLYDIYNSYEGVANLKTVNDNAGRQPVKVDRRIIELLKFGKEAYELTEGKVNIASGVVLSLWHDARTEGVRLPDAAALQEASLHMNIDDVMIDETASTVFLRDPAMRLDVGGIAKGYATEQVAQHLEEKGVENMLLSIGGNIRAIGAKGDGEKWVCPVQSPFQEPEKPYAATTYLDGMSLITSGDYERFYMVDGKRYHHIIDPETLYPGSYHRSVSILARDSGLADALSTGVFLMPLEEGLAFVEALDGVEALWVEADGTTVSSSGFDTYTEKE